MSSKKQLRYLFHLIAACLLAMMYFKNLLFAAVIFMATNVMHALYLGHPTGMSEGLKLTY